MRGSIRTKPAGGPIRYGLGLTRGYRNCKLEAKISPLPPVVLGGLLVVPQGLVDAMAGRRSPVDTQEVAARARAIVMEVERGLGYEPTDREFDRLGYDIESRMPDTRGGCASLRSRAAQAEQRPSR